MSLMNLSPAAAMTLVKSALLSGVLMTLTPAIVLGQQMEKKGTTPYVTHFIFRPLMSIDIPGLGTETMAFFASSLSRARTAISPRAFKS